jgi:antitoxin component YwqK of YwqJK toxin-antitoxin module
MDKIKYEKLHKGIGTDSLLYNGYDTIPFTGMATSWYKNGQMKFQGQYENGILNGKATWWSRDGRIEHEAVYVNGKLDIFCS